MVLIIPSTANGWPQNQNVIDHEKDLMASTARVMEKPSQDQHQIQQQALKCPRCDSSNTKFCYYNNYSLSQPRHFCKACKRYWTRGGTLRSVPVGGGCRKNKRVVKRAAEPSSSSNAINPLFYGSVSDADSVLGFDLQPQLNGIGSDFRNEKGFEDSNKQTQDAFISNSLLSSYSMFGSSTSTYPTMASFLASSFHQQKNFFSRGFHGLAPYEDLPMAGRDEAGIAVDEVKMEENLNRLDWNYVPSQNQTELVGPSEHSLYWNGTSVGAWLDPAYIGY